MTFDHVAHEVPDIAAAIAWYRATVPGTHVIHEDPTWGLIHAAGLRLAFVTAGQHPNHVAWRVSEEELERRAADAGVTINPHRDGTRSIYVDGPGAHTIEIISYPNGHAFDTEASR